MLPMTGQYQNTINQTGARSRERGYGRTDCGYGVTLSPCYWGFRFLVTNQV